MVSRLDHDANVRPWVLAAEAVSATIRWCGFDCETTELTIDDVAEVLSDRTRVVALTGASNLVGSRPDLTAIAAVVHAAGALFFVDGVHLTAHAPVDLGALGADVYVCSPYKFLGPHCGILAATPALLESLTPPKLLPSSSQVPERFELGTLAYELLAGTTAAIDFLADLVPRPAATSRRERLLGSLSGLEKHEEALRVELETALADLPGVRLHARARHRTPTLLLTFDRHEPAELHRRLAEHRVNAPAGSFYAIETSRWLGLGDAGGLRVGLAPYTDTHDVARLLEALHDELGRPGSAAT